MKKITAIICLLVLCSGLYACKPKTPEVEPLAETELYVFNGFMEKEPETVNFTLLGKLPGEDQASGDFSGSITVEEADGTEHSYEDLQYYWAEDMLILHRIDSAEGAGVLCWIDPEDPEKVVLADRNWGATRVVVAYVEDSLTDAEARSIGTVINQIPDVHKSRFVHRENALEDFVADYGDIFALGGVDAAMLRHRYAITLEDLDAKDAEKIISQIEEIPGVAEVKASTSRENACVLSYQKGEKQTAQLLEICWNCLQDKKAPVQ